MLVLTRRKDEKVVIGDGIVITVVEIRGDTVKLGIDAPREITIYRSELIDAVRQANIEATPPLSVDLDELQKKLKGGDKA